MQKNSMNAKIIRPKALLVSFLVIPMLCVSLPGQVPRSPLQFPPSARQQPSQGAKPSFLKIRVEEGRVTADITDSPMQTVLLELAARTGIIFEVRSQDNPLISIHISRIPLQEFIQRMTSGSNAAFFYGQDAESDRIKLVRVYPRTPPIQQPAIVYLGTGVVTKTINTVETPEQALQVVTGNASIEERELGIEVLVKTRSDAAIKALMACISDPAPEIKAAAIEGLAAMGANEALPAIIKTLKDEHPGVRQSATTAVALLGSSENLKDLRALSFDKDPSVAAAAEMAIRKLSATEKK
jgi:hypothetical protein